MATSILKKRRFGDSSAPTKPKKVRKQQHYSSPSASSASENDVDSFTAVDLADSDDDMKSASSKHISQKDRSSSPANSSTSASESSTSRPLSSSHPPKSTSKSKRNDPTAFASSISAILSSKLTTRKRPDPVLARSNTAQEANASIANEKLEARARKKLREDKKNAYEKGRVKDVLLGVFADGTPAEEKRTSTDAGAPEALRVAELQEKERKLKKLAQRGVIQLFNAVNAAQLKAEEARGQGGGRARKEERVGEMSKKGFLDMVASGGKSGGKKLEKEIEEA